MTFPFGMGAGFGADKARDHWKLIRRLGGTGYAQSEDSIRDRENRTDGVVTSTGATSNMRAVSQAFPQLAGEALAEWAQAQRLANVRAREQEGKQAQSVGIERISGGASAANLANAIAAFTGVSVSVAKPTAPNRIGDLIAATGLDPATVFNMALEMADSDFDDEALVESVTEVVRRIVPARNHGHHTINDVRAMLTANSAPVINDANAKFGRSTINPNLIANAYNTQPHNALMVSYGPNTAIRAEDLNRIQDATQLRDHNPAGIAVLNDDASGTKLFLTATQNTTSTQTINWITRVTDWRHRLVWVRFAQSTSDKLPGGASEDSLVGTHADLLWYTGDGTATYNVTIGDFTLKASGASGPYTNILQTVNNAAGTRYLSAFFELTRKVL